MHFLVARFVLARFHRRVTLQVLPILALALSCNPVWSQIAHPEQLFNQAVAAQKSGDTATALKIYQSLIHAYPGNIAVRVNLAGLLMDSGRLDEAIANYRAGLRFAPKNLDLGLGLDAALTGKDNPVSLQAAAADLERIHAQMPTELTPSLMLADVYVRQQKPARAVSLLQPLEEQSKDNDDFEFLLGRALLQQGDLAQGISRVDLVASRSGRTDAYLVAGQTRLNMSQFDVAKKDAEFVLAKQPDLPGAATLLGTVLARMGDYAGAGKILRTALAQDPDDFEANYDMGSLLYFNRDLQGARVMLEHALKLRPQSSEARYKLALVQQSQGELPGAVANLEVVARERPAWAEPHAKLSALYYRLHRPEDGAREAKLLEDLGTRAQSIEPATP